ncbi:MAG: thiamine pyrophosphate-binding protein, partial [Lachnospiraceae bacterium]
VLVEREEDILLELEKCVYYATTGRKGPVWIDIPLDVQAAMVDEEKLQGFCPPKKVEYKIEQKIKEVRKMLSMAKRPVILVGQGMISSKAEEEVEKLVNLLQIPVLATWRALDFMDSESENFFGSPGLQAPRFSNLIIQNCDMLIVLGSRLDNMITAFSEEHFAFRAQKVIVDIDENEINKLKIKNVCPIVSDVKEFVIQLEEAMKETPFTCNYKKWKERCQVIKEKYPICKEKQEKEEGVNLYSVTEEISKYCEEKDTIVISSTSRCNTAGHIAFRHKKGQKTISSMGMGSMGFALPSAVGAYYANGKNRVIVIEGDGSLQLNIQELETIVSHQIDAKIFIFNNNGYAAITTMQDRNFDSFYVGSNDKSGLFMPDLEKIAIAYHIPYDIICSKEQIGEKVKEVMETKGPIICDIRGSLFFDEIPKCISRVEEGTGKRISAYLENPYPFLEEEKMDEITTYLLMEEEVENGCL